MLNLTYVKCPICNKDIRKSNLKRHINGHINKHKNTYHIDHDDLFCKFCNKECKSKKSLAQHELRCKKNSNRKDFNNLSTYINTYRKGTTKETSEEVRRQANTLKEKYANNEIKPHTWPLHTSKGKGSYIIYKDKKYLCRSTYEFIYALYLLKHNIEFKMENIVVPAICTNKYAKKFICDFNIDNKIIEIKGRASAKDDLIKRSFEAAGYKFSILYWPEIKKCKEWLINNNVDIDTLIKYIYDGCKNNHYFEYIYQ